MSLHADAVRTLDGHSYRGKAALIDGGIQLSETNGNQVTVMLSNLEATVFAEATDVISGEQSVDFPWANQDIGEAGRAGGAREESNSFTIRASGSGLTAVSDGFHFVYQTMAGDGAIIAHISKLEGSPSAQVGLAIRETLGPESPGAVALVSPRDGATFQHRVSRKRPNPELHGPKISAPCWIKLEKKEKFFVGSISQDGQNWKVVGGQSVNLAPSRNREDQWFIGLAVSSHSSAGLCTATFDQVTVHSYGLKAELFTDDFQTLSKSVIISKLERGWDADLRPATVRFTGQITPKFSDRYAFSLEPKDKSRLWIDGKLILSPPQNLSEPVALQAGVPADLKLETTVARRGAVKLSWVSPEQTKELVPATALAPFPPAHATNRPSVEAHAVDSSRAQASAAGVVFKSGTLLAGVPIQVDDTTLEFRTVGGSKQMLSTPSIARLQFRSMSPQLAARIASAVPGVLLANGDFIEGDFRSFSKGRITISSVIFGFRSFAASTEAVAVVLRPFRPVGKFVVRTNAGSALFTDSVELAAGEVGLTEPFLGKTTVKSAELLDIRRLREQSH